MRRRALPVLLAAVMPAALSAADTEANNYLVRVSAAAWLPSLSGDLADRQGNGSATRVDADEFGLGDREVSPMVDVDVKVPLLPFIPNVHLGAYTFSTSGSETVSRTITFGGSTYTAGQRVDGEAKLDDLYAELNWQPLDLDMAGFGIGFGAHFLKGELTATSGGVEEGVSGHFLVPVLALRAHVNPLDALGIEAEANGTKLKAGDFDGTLLDARIQVIWRPINWLGVLGGFRYVMFDADLSEGSDTAELDLTLSGPYLGALAQF